MCKNGQKRRAVWGWLEFEWAHGHLSHRTRLQLMSIWLKYNKLLHYTMLSFLYKQTPLRGTRELASSLLCLSVCMSLSLSLCVFVCVCVCLNVSLWGHIFVLSLRATHRPETQLCCRDTGVLCCSATFELEIQWFSILLSCPLLSVFEMEILYWACPCSMKVWMAWLNNAWTIRVCVCTVNDM